MALSWATRAASFFLVTSQLQSALGAPLDERHRRSADEPAETHNYETDLAPESRVKSVRGFHSGPNFDHDDDYEDYYFDGDHDYEDKVGHRLGHGHRAHWQREEHDNDEVNDEVSEWMEPHDGDAEHWGHIEDEMHREHDDERRSHVGGAASSVRLHEKVSPTHLLHSDVKDEVIHHSGDPNSRKTARNMPEPGSAAAERPLAREQENATAKVRVWEFGGGLQEALSFLSRAGSRPDMDELKPLSSYFILSLFYPSASPTKLRSADGALNHGLGAVNEVQDGSYPRLAEKGLAGVYRTAQSGERQQQMETREILPHKNENHDADDDALDGDHGDGNHDNVDHHQDDGAHTKNGRTTYHKVVVKKRDIGDQMRQLQALSRPGRKTHAVSTPPKDVNNAAIETLVIMDSANASKSITAARELRHAGSNGTPSESKPKARVPADVPSRNQTAFGAVYSSELLKPGSSSRASPRWLSLSYEFNSSPRISATRRGVSMLFIAGKLLLKHSPSLTDRVIELARASSEGDQVTDEATPADWKNASFEGGENMAPSGATSAETSYSAGWKGRLFKNDGSQVTLTSFAPDRPQTSPSAASKAPMPAQAQAKPTFKRLRTTSYSIRDIDSATRNLHYDIDRHVVAADRRSVVAEDKSEFKRLGSDLETAGVLTCTRSGPSHSKNCLRNWAADGRRALRILRKYLGHKGSSHQLAEYSTINHETLTEMLHNAVRAKEFDAQDATGDLTSSQYVGDPAAHGGGPLTSTGNRGRREH